ncbi:MAG: hypothetical protein V3U86_06085 [Acidobacteriota bacterium]|nr:hypothetical protein [Acidobacteriota bacterium]
MNCRGARKLFLEYIFKELDREAQTSLEGHLDDCVNCRSRVLDLRGLWHSLPEARRHSLPSGVSEQVWDSILKEISAQPGRQLPRQGRGWAMPLRWAATIAAMVAGFMLGRYWDDAHRELNRFLGSPPAVSAGYFTSLNSFETASDDYLERSRLLLLELQLSEAALEELKSPWLASHSRDLLGEVPRLRRIARRLDNPQLERLLVDLEDVLGQILETSAEAGGRLHPDVESAMGRLLFKLEMLDSPREEALSSALPLTS